MTRSGPPLLPLILLGILLLASVPTASADHAYSHRYVVFGRVVDASGAPVENATVTIAGALEVGACALHAGAATDAWNATDQGVTDALGEFRLCRHQHAMRGENATLLVVATQGDREVARQEVAVDPFLRANHVTLVADANATEGHAWTSHLVAGRVWSPWVSGETLDGVPVEGFAHPGVPVRVTLGTREGEETIETQTNLYGDYAVRFDATVEDAVVAIDVEGERFTFGANESIGWTVAHAVLPPVAELVLFSASGADGRSWSTLAGEVDATLLVMPGARVSLIAVNAEDAPHDFEVETIGSVPTMTARGDYHWLNFTAPTAGTLAYGTPGVLRGLIQVATQAGEPIEGPPRVTTPTPPTQDDLPPPTSTPTTTASPSPTPSPERTPVSPLAALLALALVALAQRRRK